MKPIGVALIGCGAVALANHVPGVRLCPKAQWVGLCDNNEEVLKQALNQTGVSKGTVHYQDLLVDPKVDAVIVATPNRYHAAIVLASAEAGKAVLCEKPLAISHPESQAMLAAVESAAVCHMTAFTYRFVPAMRYMSHLVDSGAIGTPYHFRSCRLQDWGTRYLGWRQSATLAGTGELGDMLSHRIDFAHLLVGPIREVIADERRFHSVRGNEPSELEDWVGLMVRFENGATGLLESSKVASGHGEGGHSQDFCEVNGSEGSLVYNLENPHEIRIGKRDQSSLSTTAVPPEFLKLPGAPRDPYEGDPLMTFRYDQDFEFIEAIDQQRTCRPSFHDGVEVQAVMEAATHSIRSGRWTPVGSKGSKETTPHQSPDPFEENPS